MTALDTTLVGTPGDGWIQDEAAHLDRAARRRRPVTVLSRRRPGLTLSDAYRVQRCWTALRVGQGARVVGRKVGLTSEAMRRQVGINEPDCGILLDSMAVLDGGVLRTDALVAPRIEAEIAFRLGTALREDRGHQVGEDDARAAVAEVFLALEVIDTRYALPGITLSGITLADSVADNAGCARFVLGGPVPMSTMDQRLCAEELTVSSGGRVAAIGQGQAILGDPIRSVVWLAQCLAVHGAGLVAGEVVLAGAVHASIPLVPGDTVSVCSPHLPPVSVTTV